jgi:hypothetical protein
VCLDKPGEDHDSTAGSKSALTSYVLPVKDLQLIFLASFLRTPVSVMHITLLLFMPSSLPTLASYGCFSRGGPAGR